MEACIKIDAENKQQKPAAFQSRKKWPKGSNSGLLIMWNHSSEVMIAGFWEANR